MKFIDLPDDMLSEICNKSTIKDLKSLIKTNRDLRKIGVPILNQKVQKIKISCSSDNSLIIDEGIVLSCGFNNGQLGLGDEVSRTNEVCLGDNISRNVFRKTNLSNIISISGGGSHFVVLDNNGNVWTSGSNYYGQLGLGDQGNISRNVFTKTNLNNIISISSGLEHSFVLDVYGNLWTCGSNCYGQLGLGDNINRNIFTKTNLNNIKSISAVDNHLIALDNNGNVLSCGSNNYGQLGLGNNINRNVFKKTNLSNIQQISVGCEHSLALDNNGNVYSCGNNYYGQLGLGDKVSRTNKVCLGGNSDRNVFTKTNLNNIKLISCGGYSSLAIDIDGNVYSCGNNRWGQLGLGDYKKRNVFTKTNLSNIISISCGSDHSLALDMYGNIYSCGSNKWGQLGFGDPEKINRNIFTKINLF